MSAFSLPIGLAKYQLLRERLLAEYPLLDADTVSDSLEGITDLHEMIAAVIRSALVDEALQIGLRSRLDHMRERLTRLELRGEKKRQLALEAIDRGRSQETRTARLHCFDASWVAAPRRRE